MRSNIVLIVVLLILIGIVGVIIYFGAPALEQARRQERTPKPLQVWVLASTSSDPIPSTESKILTGDEDVKLYALIKVEDPETHTPFFISSAKKIRLYGKEIAVQQTWDAEKWLPLELFWYRIDSIQTSDGNFRFQKTFLKDWGTTTWEKAFPKEERKPVTVAYHDMPYGTTRFMLEVRVPLPDGKTLYAKESSGLSELERDPTTSSVHRLVFFPEGDEAHVALAFLNVPFVKVGVSDAYIRNFVVLTPFQFPLAVYELKYGEEFPDLSLNEYEQRTEILFQDVRCTEDTGKCVVQEKKRRRKVERNLSFGTDVQPGDLLMTTERACFLYEDSGSDGEPNGVLDVQDLIVCGHPDDKPPFLMVQALGSRFPVNQFEIRRYRQTTDE